MHCYSGKMSQGREVEHLGVINNSHADHRDYTEKTRTAEGRNHRAEGVKTGQGEEKQDPPQKQTSGYKWNNNMCQNRQKTQ